MTFDGYEKGINPGQSLWSMKQEEQDTRPGLVVLTCDPNVRKIEVGGAWVWDNSGLHEILPQNQNKEEDPEFVKVWKFTLISRAFHIHRLKGVTSLCSYFLHLSILCSFSPGTNTELSYMSKERENGDSRNPVKGKQKDTGAPGRSPSPRPQPQPLLQSLGPLDRDLKVLRVWFLTLTLTPLSWATL